MTPGDLRRLAEVVDSYTKGALRWAASELERIEHERNVHANYRVKLGHDLDEARAESLVHHKDSLVYRQQLDRAVEVLNYYAGASSWGNDEDWCTHRDLGQRARECLKEIGRE